MPRYSPEPNPRTGLWYELRNGSGNLVITRKQALMYLKSTQNYRVRVVQETNFTGLGEVPDSDIPF
jgi:hypothetical protein